MTKKSKMDRGLDSLFFDNSIDEITRSDSESVKNNDGENGISTVRISLIEPDKNQPRSEFDEDALNELAENIRQHGVLQPILVRPLDNGGYKIVAGERRWRAARLAGLDEIPVYIKELTDLEAAEISLIENIQRKDLTPLEEAAAYETLMETYGLTQQQVAEAVGRSRSAVANSVRLLSLSENVQEMLRDKKLTEGHAKVLAGVADGSVTMEIWNGLALAGGAATAGCCAHMLGFAILSFPDNGIGGFVAQGLGTSMLQVPNLMKKPILWLPPVITSAITGPIATCVFHMRNNGPAISSGMGTSGLVGPIGVVTGWVQMPEGYQTGIFEWIGMILICFVLPLLITWVIGKIFRAKGLIKPGDLKIDLG